MSIKQVPAGNIKPDKEKSAERIRGGVSPILGVTVAAMRTKVANPYENRGIDAI